MTGQSLEWYGGRIRRHRLLVWGCTAVATAGGFGIAWSQPEVYHSTAVVVATPQPPPGSGREGLRRAPTVDSDAQVLASDRVLQRAAETTGYPGGLTALRDNVDVTARSTSRVLRVRVTADEPETARDTADAVAAGFLHVRAAADDARFDRVRDGLTVQIDMLSERLAAATERSTSPMHDPEVESLRQELAALYGQLTTTQATIQASGFVAEPARLPPAGTRPHLITTTVSAGLLGLAAGAGLAAGRRETTTGADQ